MMRLSRLVLPLGIVLLLGGALYGCSSSDDTTATGTGGSTAAGGSTGTGGGALTGGAPGSGGTVVSDGGTGGKGGGAAGTTDAGDGATQPSFASLIPAGTEISGWTASTKAGLPQVAFNYADAITAVDGTAEAFFTDSYKAVAMGHQFYTRPLSDGGTDTIEFFLWQMPSAADAQALYTALPTNSDQLWVELKDAVTPVIGDRAISGARATAPHVLVQKGAYVLDFKGGVGLPLADIIAFATAAVAKLP